MQIVRILHLADQLEADIQARGLKPGDPYLGTEETARLLRVSSAMASRALQLLVKRGVLHRRQRVGTFVAGGPGNIPVSGLAKVHLLVQRDYVLSEGVLMDGVVLGIQSELPGARVEFNFISPEGSQESMHRLMAECLRSPDPEGFVLVRCPVWLQRLLENSGLPAVIGGWPHPSIHRLPWMDRDQVRMGEFLVQYLLSRGCTRVVVLFRQQVYPGDHVMLDRIQEVAGEAGFRLKDLTVRCLAQDKVSVAEETCRLMRQWQGQPVGFICRSMPLAEGVSEGLHRMGLPKSAVEIVVSDVYRRPDSSMPAYVHTREIVSPEEQGHRFARMLLAQAQGQRPEPDHEILPVELVVPPGLEKSSI